MEIVKVLAQSAPAATTLTDAYAVPAATQATVSTVTVANRSSTPDVFRISVAVAGAADAVSQYLYYDVTVPGNDTFAATIGITLQATDVIRVYSTNATLTFNIFGVTEIIDADYTAILTLGGARVSRSTNQTISNNTLTAVIFDAEEYDDVGFWDISNPDELIVPVGYAGRYVLSAWVPYAANATGTRSIQIAVNGTGVATSRAAITANTGSVSAAVAIDLAEGDSVTFPTHQTSGGDLDLVGGFIGASIQRVGLALGTVPAGPIVSSALTCNDNVLLGRFDSGGGSAPIVEIPFEKGTFAPTVTFQTPGDVSVSYSIQYGDYIRIGNYVTVNIRVVFTPTFTTASSNFNVDNMPFTSGAQAPVNGVAIFSGTSGSTAPTMPAGCSALICSLGTGTVLLFIQAYGASTGLTNFTTSNITSGVMRELRATVTYMTA